MRCGKGYEEPHQMPENPGHMSDRALFTFSKDLRSPSAFISS